MNNLLLTLGVGIGLILLANVLLYWFTSMSARQAAVAVSAATIGIYVPLSVFYWPGLDVAAIHMVIFLISSYVFGMIMGALRDSDEQPGGSRFHWGPAAIIGFFVCLVIVDSVFILLAERGLPSHMSQLVLPDARTDSELSFVFPGMVAGNFREKETRFHDYRRQLEKQQARGWQVRKGWLGGRPVSGEPAVFKVAAATRDGEPLENAEVTGHFLRPSDSRLDTVFEMREVEPGQYEATLQLPVPGSWNLVLRLRRGDDLHEIRAATSVAERRVN